MKLARDMLFCREGAAAQEIALIAGAIVLAAAIAVLAAQSKNRVSTSITTAANKLDNALASL